MNKYIVTTDAYNEEVEIVHADDFNVDDGCLIFFNTNDNKYMGDVVSAYAPSAWDKVELAVEDEANPE